MTDVGAPGLLVLAGDAARRPAGRASPARPPSWRRPTSSPPRTPAGCAGSATTSGYGPPAGSCRYFDGNEQARTPGLVAAAAGRRDGPAGHRRRHAAGVRPRLPAGRRGRRRRGCRSPRVPGPSAVTDRARRLRAAGRPVLLRGLPAAQGGRAAAAAGRARRRAAHAWSSSRRRTGWPRPWPTWPRRSAPDRPAAVCRELTKTYEEVRRGGLAELAEWAADGVRGEITLVVSARPRRAGRPGEAADEARRPGRRRRARQDAAAEVGDQPAAVAAEARPSLPPAPRRL